MAFNYFVLPSPLVEKYAIDTVLYLSNLNAQLGKWPSSVHSVMVLYSNSNIMLEMVL